MKGKKIKFRVEFYRTVGLWICGSLGAMLCDCGLRPESGIRIRNQGPDCQDP